MDINELTYKINGAIYEVNRILGSGFLEKVYRKALLKSPKKNPWGRPLEYWLLVIG